jgi:hypothetical protein
MQFTGNIRIESQSRFILQEDFESIVIISLCIILPLLAFDLVIHHFI